MFMPIIIGGIWILFLSLTFAGLSTYGTLFFSMRKSTIIKNISITSNQTSTLYFATFWMIFISIFTTITIVILTLITFDSIGIMKHWMDITNGTIIDSTTGEEIVNPVGIWYTDYSEICWGMLLHYALLQTFLCFSISFFAEQVVSTQRNFFIFAMIYIVAGIFFSGIFCQTIYIDEFGLVDVIEEGMTTQELGGVTGLSPYLWGNFSWLIGQFFPHFGINQLSASIFAAGSWHYEIINPVYDSSGKLIEATLGEDIVWNNWHDVTVLGSLDSIRIKYYAFMPWIWSLILIYFGSMLERYNKN